MRLVSVVINTRSLRAMTRRVACAGHRSVLRGYDRHDGSSSPVGRITCSTIWSLCSISKDRVAGDEDIWAPAP